MVVGGVGLTGGGGNGEEGGLCARVLIAEAMRGGRPVE